MRLASSVIILHAFQHICTCAERSIQQRWAAYQAARSCVGEQRGWRGRKGGGGCLADYFLQAVLLCRANFAAAGLLVEAVQPNLQVAHSALGEVAHLLHLRARSAQAIARRIPEPAASGASSTQQAAARKQKVRLHMQCGRSIRFAWQSGGMSTLGRSLAVSGRRWWCSSLPAGLARLQGGVWWGDLGVQGTEEALLRRIPLRLGAGHGQRGGARAVAHLPLSARLGLLHRLLNQVLQLRGAGQARAVSVPPRWPGL